MAIGIKPIKRSRMSLRVVGLSPIQMHQWDEKAKRQMREKHAGKKTKAREVRDCEAECEAATYRLADGRYGIPCMAFKHAMIGAAHKDLGIEKTLVRKAVFIHCDDPGGLLPLVEYSEPFMREDIMRVGMGTVDMRYRPQFDQWAVDLTLEVDMELLNEQDIVSLIDRAGFGVGVLEGRPEKGRDFGRFKVDADHPVKVETLSA